MNATPAMSVLPICLRDLIARFLLAAVMALALPVWAADQFLPPEQAFAVSARMVAPQRVEVLVRITSGYYVYREPFRFSAEGATLGPAELPAGQVKFDTNFQKNVETYRDELRIALPLAQSGGPFKLKVVTQGCADAGLCYPPMSTELRLDPALVAGDQTLAARQTGAGLLDAEGAIVDRMLRAGRLLPVLGLFFGLGLLLSLTPCVLPMLPILSSLILGSGERPSRWRGLALASAYSLGMALVYTSLGLAAGLAGEGFAAALQTPWAIGAFSALLAFFALSMFDVYELRLPARFTGHMSGHANRLPAGQFAGVFVMGGVSALIVSPCVTAPLAGALLFISQTGDVVLGGAALFAMAAGMSVPLLLLGVSAGQWLPKAGAWMQGVKQLFGVMMLGVALWVARPVLPAALVMLLWGLVLLLSGFLLQPFSPLTHHRHVFRVALQRSLGVAALTLGVMQMVGAGSGGQDPLRPLEQEIFLVQSNGVAEWLKMALASQGGIFAAARVELPGRFLWRAYRQMLGRDAVPLESAMDKLPLTWRLMRHLPELAQAPGFEPLAGFLHQGEMDRRLQLAQRLADLYDQYQVYRDDWLAAWAVGDDSLPSPAPGAARALPGDQRWQAMLWRELLAPLDQSQRAGIRSQLNSRFMAALGAGASPVAPLARRVVLFGMSQVPMQTLQALAALSTHCQVLLAIPNPCRYHWADTIAGRELLQLQRHRHPLRLGRDLADVPLEQMHAHAHPLLAAWGRQGRDFVRQLDAFDDAQLAQQRFPLAKVDLFEDAPGLSLLQQVQASIRDLVPLAEQPRVRVDIGDRSIVFHIAHSLQREVEILHDQLLALLADPPEGRPLQPREIVVMVPDIARFAPAVRAVFGQPGRGDARFIPFDIADLAERGNNPLLIALEWLLRLPQQRCRLSELRDLLDVPALAQRFGLQAGDLPQLNQWMEGAGIRWGLNAAQRAEQGLAACGDQNSWLFGLRRMLLGYAVGEPGPIAGALVDATAIEPYAEIGGLEASIAGSLAALVDSLQQWSALAAIPATPTDWAARGLLLLSSMIAPTDERERLTVAALQASLAGWLAACETAGFDQPVPLAVAREAWLAGIDEPALSRRFKSGGVTFCTLLPAYFSDRGRLFQSDRAR